MHATSELTRFAARLRGLIASTWTSEGAAVGLPEFEPLALELFALQFEHNAPYRRFCQGRGAQPGTVACWADIPAIPTTAFKEWELSCLPASERTAAFYSSCTTVQQPSRHFHNTESLALYEASLLAWFKSHFSVAGAGWRLAILAPPPAQAPHSSLVHMFATIRREYAVESPYSARLAEDGGWSLDSGAAVRLLRDAAAGKQPLMLLGTAFCFVHLLDHLAGQNLRFELPPGSCALETGGYKGRSRTMPQPALHALISERLGIPPTHIVCEYGMSELSSQAYDSTLGSPDAPGSTLHAPRLFRFPPWARAQIVSPETGREVGEGETGLLRVFDLANVYSVMAIQTEDLATRRAEGFTLAGRAALSEPRGCSLMPKPNEQ